MTFQCGLLVDRQGQLHSAPAVLLRRQIVFGVLRQIDFFPLALLDPSANLGRSLALLGLLVGVEPFLLADIAAGPMAADKTIEQAAVSAAAVAVAVARL